MKQKYAALQKYLKIKGLVKDNYRQFGCQLFLSRHTARTICLIRIAHSSVRQFEVCFCYCSNEMQLRHIWRAKQNNSRWQPTRRYTRYYFISAVSCGLNWICMPVLAGMRALGARGRWSPLVVVTCHVCMPVLRSQRRLSVEDKTASKHTLSASW